MSEYLETPDYGKENFMSDVGGTAGLILGISFATIVGLIDICMQYVVRLILASVEKVMLLTKSLDWEPFMKFNTTLYVSFIS